ncbi:MAG: LapA family protein [Chloroflexota bacterium]
MIVSILLTIAVTIVAVIFAMANPEAVTVTFFGANVQGQMGVFMLVAFGVGILLGIVLMLPSLIGRSISNAMHRRKIAELEGKPK